MKTAVEIKKFGLIVDTLLQNALNNNNYQSYRCFTYYKDIIDYVLYNKKDGLVESIENMKEII